MQSLVSDFFVYNSTGKLLSGEGEVYSNEYSNLAKQIDSKRNALYFELTEKGSTLILGCSVMVEEVGGREERIVCVGKCGYAGNDPAQIMHFYERVSAEIPHLQKLQYRVIGLWEENDINDFSRLKELTVDETMADYVYGKLLANEKVSVKSASAINAVSMINSAFVKVGNSLESDLKFMASRYPYESDISICPIEPNADFELAEHGLKWKQSPRYSEYYILLPRVFREKAGEIKSYVGEVNDRNRLSIYTKNFAFRAYTRDVFNIFATSESLYTLLELYKNDISILTQIFKERSAQIRQMPITNEITVANIVALYSKQLSSQSSMFSYMGEDEALKSLFERIRNPDIKKKLDISLLKNKGLWSYVIKDTIRRIYADEDKELLAALCNVGFTYGDNNGDRFSKHVAAALSSYDKDKLVDLLRIVANNISTSPSSGGKIFVNHISTQLRAYDLSSKLTMDEAETLDSYFGTIYSVQKKNKLNSKKKRMLTLGSYAVLLVLFAGILFLILMLGSPLLSPNNSSNEDSFFNSLKDNAYSFFNISREGNVYGNESSDHSSDNSTLGINSNGDSNEGSSVTVYNNNNSINETNEMIGMNNSLDHDNSSYLNNNDTSPSGKVVVK